MICYSNHDSDYMLPVPGGGDDSDVDDIIETITEWCVFIY